MTWFHLQWYGIHKNGLFFITSLNILEQLQVWRQRTLSPEVFWKIVFHSPFYYFSLIYLFIANSSILYYHKIVMFETLFLVLYIFIKRQNKDSIGFDFHHVVFFFKASLSGYNC